MRQKRVIVAGGRDFTDYLLLSTMMKKYHGDERILIVSGGARGADRLAERYATENGLDVKVFLADWNVGKRAGPERNARMVAFADEAVVFWDGKSPGTADTVRKMRDAGKIVRVVSWSQNC